jgi:2-keto-4-pentenoate hydratase
VKEREQLKQQWTRAIFEAQRNGKTIAPPSTSFGELSLEEAYEVQARVAAEHVAVGHRQIGWKVGATSFAILEQMKGILDGPMYGFMTSESVCGQKGEIRRSDYSLGIEAEIGVVLEAPLRGPGITTLDVPRAIGGVVALVELLQTRFEGQASVPDGAADNSAHGGIVIGGRVASATDFDFIHEGVVIKRNGRAWLSGCGAEALGSPLHVMAWLANELGQRGQTIEAGHLVATGSLTSILIPEVGDVVDISFANLGAIQLGIVE